jgi:DNA repair exonuclease SbcCD nuclease subunit
MKVLLFSDLHGHAFKPHSVTLSDGRNSRLQDAVEILREIHQVCINYEIDIVLFAGDLFHSRGILRVSTFNSIYEEIARIKTVVSSFGMLVGNHDQETKHGDVHACYAFDSIVQVLDRGGWHTFFGSNDNERLHVFAVPYTTDKEEIESLLKIAETSKPPGEPTCCLAHIGISGAEVGSNFVLVNSDNPTIIPFTRPKFDQVFLGHYHKYQLLAQNVRYIGSTHQHNWGDVGQNRGYCIWDTDDGSVSFTGLRSAPKFVWHDADEMVTDSTLEKKVKGNFVRVKYDTQPDPRIWKKAKQSIKDHGARWVELWVEPTVTSEVTPEDESKYQPGTDLEDMIETFVKDSDTPNLDKNLLISLGKRILKGVQ